jgi:hypothetical protein
MAHPLGPARRHGGGRARARGVKALPLLVLAVLLGPLPLGAGGERAEAVVARLIAEAKADVRAEIAAERELARENLAAVLGRLNRTEADLDRTRGDLNQTKTDLNQTRAALRGAEGRLGARLTRCETNASALAQLQGAWEARRLQSQGPASQGESVTLFRRDVTHLALHAGADGTGHRILQAACDAETLRPRTEAVTAECCDEPGEDCSSGAPRSPNAGCCAILVPFLQDCAAEMGAGVDSIRSVVETCPAGGGGPAPTASAVLLFSAVCPPGVLLETCIPVCDATTNGFVLLLNQVRRRGRPADLLHLSVRCRARARSGWKRHAVALRDAKLPLLGPRQPALAYIHGRAGRFKGA